MRHLDFLFNRGVITVKDIQLNEENNAEGRMIAKKLGIRFLGFWADMGKYIFSDDDGTGTSFTAKDFKEAKDKLIQKYKDFGLVYAK